MSEGAQPGAVILERVRESLRRSEVRSNHLRRRNSLSVYVTLAAGGLGTVIAAFAAAAGPALGAGPHAWKVTCGIVAVLTACGTLASGLGQQLSLPDRLARATACWGRLKALEIEVSLGGCDLAKATQEFEQIAAGYPDCMS